MCLVQNRELEIGIYWKDWRQLCAVKFLRLEEFIEDNRHGMVIEMEPQGILFAEVKFLMNPMISRKPNLKRQRVFQRESSTFRILVCCSLLDVYMYMLRSLEALLVLHMPPPCSVCEQKKEER